MTTVKEFEKRKQEIIDELNSIDPQQINVEYAIFKLCGLQLPKPLTCLTCKHWIQEDLQVTKDSVYPHKTCDNLQMWKNISIGSDKKAKLVFINPTKDFGCPFHSDYDGDLDDNS